MVSQGVQQVKCVHDQMKTESRFKVAVLIRRMSEDERRHAPHQRWFPNPALYMLNGISAAVLESRQPSMLHRPTFLCFGTRSTTTLMPAS